MIISRLQFFANLLAELSILTAKKYRNGECPSCGLQLPKIPADTKPPCTNLESGMENTTGIMLGAAITCSPGSKVSLVSCPSDRQIVECPRCHTAVFQRKG